MTTPKTAKPESNLFHAILKHLYNNYPLDNRNVEINDFLLNDLSMEKNSLPQAIKIRDVLIHLQAKGFITWGYNPKLEGALPFGTPPEVKPYLAHERTDTMTLEFHKVYVTLTLDGFNYYLDVERKSELHHSITATNKANVRNGVFTLIVAIAAVLVALIPLFKKAQEHNLLVPQPLQLDTTLVKDVQSSRQNIESILEVLRENSKKSSSPDSSLQ